jgi:hypothetical protein
VIKEMGLAIQDGAKLIQEYISSSFFGKIREGEACIALISTPIVRAARNAISSDMANRIEACKGRFAYLNEQFDRTVSVRVWENTDKLVDGATRKG